MLGGGCRLVLGGREYNLQALVLLLGFRDLSEAFVREPRGRAVWCGYSGFTVWGS